MQSESDVFLRPDIMEDLLEQEKGDGRRQRGKSPRESEEWVGALIPGWRIHRQRGPRALHFAGDRGDGTSWRDELCGVSTVLDLKSSEDLHCSSRDGSEKWSQHEAGEGKVGAGLWVALPVWVPQIEQQGPAEDPGTFREDTSHKESWISSARGVSRDFMDPIISHKTTGVGLPRAQAGSFSSLWLHWSTPGPWRSFA